MSIYITKNRILDFTVSLKIQHRSPNTITSYTTNIQKLELFLGGSELTKEQMLSYKQWLYSQGFKQRTINAYFAAANYFCDVMGWTEMKVALGPVIEENTGQKKKIQDKIRSRFPLPVIKNLCIQLCRITRSGWQ